MYDTSSIFKQLCHSCTKLIMELISKFQYIINIVELIHCMTMNNVFIYICLFFLEYNEISSFLINNLEQYNI